MERLENKLGETRRIMNEAIDRLLPIPAGREKRVVEAMRYSAISTGKALRPFLTMTIIIAVAVIRIATAAITNIRIIVAIRGINHVKRNKRFIF